MIKKFLIIPLLLLLFACQMQPTKVCLLVDQTDSTKELRANENIVKLTKALKARPNFQVSSLGMMPDRIYPLSESSYNDSYGANEGNYTGGDLETGIKTAIKFSEPDIMIIITDGENNFGNIDHGAPKLPSEQRYIFIGVVKEKWQGYLDQGYETYTIDEVPDLIRKLVIHGTL